MSERELWEAHSDTGRVRIVSDLNPGANNGFGWGMGGETWRNPDKPISQTRRFSRAPMREPFPGSSAIGQVCSKSVLVRRE
ncbi:hypothetical protein MUP29_09630 [bacterium]|nr:hypothetical protein [bacterium]